MVFKKKKCNNVETNYQWNLLVQVSRQTLYLVALLFTKNIFQVQIFNEITVYDNHSFKSLHTIVIKSLCQHIIISSQNSFTSA